MKHDVGPILGKGHLGDCAGLYRNPHSEPLISSVNVVLLYGRMERRVNRWICRCGARSHPADWYTLYQLMQC